MNKKVQYLYEDGVAKYAVVDVAYFNSLVGENDSPIVEVEPDNTPTLSLSEARIKAKKSPAILARDIGVSVSYYQMLECGERALSDVQKRSILQALGMTQNQIKF